MNLPPQLSQDYLGQVIKEHFEKVQRLESENLSLKQSNGRLESKNASLEADVSLLEQLNEGLNNQIRSIHEDNLNLKAENERLEACNSSPRPTHYQPQMDALRNRTNILRRLLDNLESDVNELQVVISGCD